jgi:hypothetical protein
MPLLLRVYHDRTTPAVSWKRFMAGVVGTLTCEYIREFSTKFELILMFFSGSWEKMIHEKNLKQKI